MTEARQNTVAIATRIYEPEPAAAAFRLAAVTRSCLQDGLRVRVLTTAFDGIGSSRSPSLKVLRWPVLRDSKGYVRGYLPYLSFDVPLFFRVLFGPRPDVMLVEPPPTTGAAARVACTLRRIPYVWYAADIWSDASASTGAPAPVVAAVRALERFSVRGASIIVAVSEGVAARVRELGGSRVRGVPNGVDTRIYNLETAPLSPAELAQMGISKPYFLYAGTASEWQDAQAFGAAFLSDPELTDRFQLVYVGGGSRWADLERLQSSAPAGSIILSDTVPPGRVASLLRGARAALVSIAPGKDYDFAYPTKVLAALACGTPVLYAGPGPARADVERGSFGLTCSTECEDLAAALRRIAEIPWGPAQARAAHDWVQRNRSLDRVGRQVASLLEETGGISPGRRKAATSSKLLVLLTNQFPDARGDSAFLQNEIEELAARFDRVVVLSREAANNPVHLPGNVTYAGTIAAPRTTLIPALLEPAVWRRVARAAAEEMRSGRRRGQPLRAAAEILAGVKFARRIEECVRPGEEVTVYSYWGVAGAQALPFLPAGFRKIVRLHGGDLYEGSPALPLRVPLFKAADKILTVSEHGKTYLQENFPELRANPKLQVSRLGTRPIDGVEKPSQGKTLHLVSCSTVDQNKRVGAILQAAQAASLTRPVRWTHLGSGPLFEDLTRQVRAGEHDYPGLSVDLRGQVTNQEVADFHSRHPAHVFVALSDSEGVPVAVMEALAAGIPAVATDAGGTRELVGESTRSGVLLPLRPAPETVAQAVLQVAEDRASYQPRDAWANLADARKTAREAADQVAFREQSTPKPQAQVVIAVHAPDRPVRRAVESVLADPAAGAIVVAHGVELALLDLPQSDRVLTTEFSEKIGSPGAAFNHGLSLVSAPLSGIMGSDDWYEPGAISTMATRQSADNADGVLAPLSYQGVGRELNPLTVRRRGLHARRDRLFYRTAPLGLFRSELMQNPRYQMRLDVPVGGDHQPSLALWTDGLRISHYPQDPAYVVGSDARERVTTKRRPLEQSLAPLTDLVESGVVAGLTPGDRVSLISKQLRIHILHPVTRRVLAHRRAANAPSGAAKSPVIPLTQEELREYSKVARILHRTAPGAAKSLSAADQAILLAILKGNLADVGSAVEARSGGSVLRRVLPRNPLRALDTEANAAMLLTRLAVHAQLWFTDKRKK